jgi:hypothetical protein
MWPANAAKSDEVVKPEIDTGVPSANNTHEVAQWSCPNAAWCM